MHVSKSSWVLHYTKKIATKPYDGSAAANLLGSLFYNKEYDYSVFHVDGNTTKEFSVKLYKNYNNCFSSVYIKWNHTSN